MTSTMSDRLESMRGTFGSGNRNDRDPGTRIRRIFIAGTVLLGAVILLPNAMSYVNPGHVGILIHRAGGGVDPRPLGPGVHLRNPLLSAIE